MGASSDIRKIDKKINYIYNNLGTIFDSKEDFEQAVIDSYKDRLSIYLKDKTNQKYFKNKINEFWKKIINDKYKQIKVEEEKNRKKENKIENLLKSHREEIEKIQKVNKIELQKQEQNKQLLEETINQLKEHIKKLEIESENEKKKFEDFKINIMDKIQKNISGIEKRMKDEKEEENMKRLQRLKDIEIRNKQLCNLYNTKFNHIKKVKLQEIENNFIKNEKEFCKEEIKKFDQKKIKIFINNFLQNEKIPKFILNYLIELIDLNKPETKVEHLNILLVGPSGVGKSTLVSSILDVEVKAGFGCPQTNNIESFESENIPFLRLFDSRGIEKSIHGVKETFDSIKNFIQKQIENKDSDKYIHIIWYCWTGTRLEGSELDLLKKLSEQYKLDTLPIIIVYTNSAFRKEAEQARQYVKDTVKLENEFIDVLAKEKEIDDKNIIKSKNLDILIEKSIGLAKSAVKSALVEGLIGEVKEKIKFSIDSLTSEIKEEINGQVINFIEKIDKEAEIMDFQDKIKNIILNVLYRYFVLTPDNKIIFDKETKIKCGEVEFTFSDQSLVYLDNFILDYFRETLEIYKNKLDEYINKYSKELSNEITLFTAQFNNQNNILIKPKKTEVELNIIFKEEIQKKLEKTSRLAALKNSFIFIIEPLINKIGEYFLELYKKGIGQKKFTEFSRDSVKASFEEIEKKIKEYNESLKEKENKDEENDKKEAAPTNLDDITKSVASEVNKLYEYEYEDKD
jgi:predicted GTPase